MYFAYLNSFDHAKIVFILVIFLLLLYSRTPPLLRSSFAIEYVPYIVKL
jgi:hypothetical protein